MDNGIIPPVQLYPKGGNQLLLEIEHEDDPDHFATVTLTKAHVKHLLAILQDWYDNASDEIQNDFGITEI